MILTATHQRDTSSNVPDKNPGRAAHDLRPADPLPAAPTQEVVEDEDVVTGGSPDMSPVHVHGVDHVGKGVDDAVQPAGPGGKCARDENVPLSLTTRPVGRDWKDRVIGGAALVFDVAKAAAEAFGPLKAALEAASTVYDQYKVRSWRPIVKHIY